MFGTKTGNIAVELADSEGNWARKEIQKLSSHPISAIRCATIVREKDIKFAVSSFDRSIRIFALEKREKREKGEKGEKGVVFI